MGKRRRPHQPYQRRTSTYRRCRIVSVAGPHHAPTFTAETALYGQVKPHEHFIVYEPNADRSATLLLRAPYFDLQIKQLGPYASFSAILQGGPKIGTIFVRLITLPNINRFSKLFRYQNQEKICNNDVTKDPITPHVCRYTTL